MMSYNRHGAKGISFSSNSIYFYPQVGEKDEDDNSNNENHENKNDVSGDDNDSDHIINVTKSVRLC